MKMSIKKTICLVCVVCLVFAMGVPAFATGSVSALSTSSTVLVNGSNVSFQAYNIGGNNYFKLRDIAKALSGTAKQFEVGVSGTSIVLTSGKAYTPVGGELVTSGSTASVSATLSSWTVSLDGAAVRLTAYNIGGNNYFKLRDVAGAINFGVGFNSTSNTITIDTTTGYATDSTKTTSIAGVWSYKLTNEPVITVFYDDGTYLIYDYTTTDNTTFYSGVYSMTATEINFVNDQDESESTYSYVLKTANGKTTMVLSGNTETGPVTFNKQSDSSIIGAWGDYDEDNNFVVSIFYEDGTFEAGSITEDDEYSQTAVGTYTTSGKTLSMAKQGGSTLAVSYEIKTVDGKVAIVMTSSDGKTATLYRV